jgi:hypothetical protein
MALFRMQLRQAINRPDLGQQYKWSNLYYVEAASLVIATAFGPSAWAILKDATNENAFCYEVYTSDLVPGTTVYSIDAIPTANQPGTLTGSGGFLPNFNVVRVELNVAGGRPSRKYHRMPLQEGDIVLGSLEAAASAAIQDTYDALLASIIPLRDESGNELTSVTLKGITSRRVGKLAYTGVPPAPA